MSLARLENWLLLMMMPLPPAERAVPCCAVQTGADREVQRILMELLTQMDGFEQNTNVKVSRSCFSVLPYLRSFFRTNTQRHAGHDGNQL